MRVILDTSVLITDSWELLAQEVAISVVSVAELNFGVQACKQPKERLRRSARFQIVQDHFDPLPVTSQVAQTWGSLAALSLERDLQPRRRAMDLLIAATAIVEQVPLVTLDQDFVAFQDVVDLRFFQSS